MSKLTPVKALTPATAQLAIPPDVRDLLGSPPIIAGEDPDRYERLLAQVAAALGPRDIIDWLRYRDVADLTWKLERIQAVDRTLFAALAREALADTLQSLRGAASAITPSLVDEWCTGDQQAREEVDKILRSHGVDEQALMAHTVLRHLPQFDALGRMEMTTRTQRDRVVAELRRTRVDVVKTPRERE